MRKTIIFIASILCCLWAGAQQTPEWVKQRPTDPSKYVGIGTVKKTEKDFAQKAKQQALNDLVSGIKVEVSVNSLLNTMEANGTAKQAFAESVKTKAQAEIERFRLVDTWQSNAEYWVYYELTKKDYEEYMEARRQKAIRTGGDFWSKGQAALQKGELTSAAELFSKGLEAIQPVMNQELTCSVDGRNINLASELYASLMNVFSGLAIVVNPTVVEGKSFKGITDPIAVGAYRNGTPVRNIRLKAAFLSGSGDLSSLPPTDETGVAPLYIRNITSKQAQQEVRISLMPDALKSLQTGSNAALFKRLSMAFPEASLTIQMEKKQIAACIKTGKNEIESVEQAVKSILTNNYFNVTENEGEADVIVHVDNSFKVGRQVPGQMYNFVECFSSLLIRVADNRSQATLLNYTVNDLRTLVPEDKSATQGKNMAGRELLKRMQREFDRELKKITIETEVEVPAIPADSIAGDSIVVVEPIPMEVPADSVPALETTNE